MLVEFKRAPPKVHFSFSLNNGVKVATSIASFAIKYEIEIRRASYKRKSKWFFSIQKRVPLHSISSLYADYETVWLVGSKAK